MRFCNGVDENFQHHFVTIKITVGMKISQLHHKTCPMVLESCWNEMKTNTIAKDGFDAEMWRRKLEAEVIIFCGSGSTLMKEIGSESELEATNSIRS